MVTALLTISACLLTSCSTTGGSRNANFLGTFEMGERVQAPPFTYTVLEANWRGQLGDAGRIAKHRFLFVRVSATNSGGTAANIPAFQLESTDGKTSYQEETADMDGVPNWLGMLRNVEPGQTENGYVVFDAPMGTYNLVLYDGGELEKEKHAFVSIPLNVE